MLCFNKLTGEHNAKKIQFKNFVLWEYIFNRQKYHIYYLSQSLGKKECIN